MEQIFNLRIFCEKYTQHQQGLYHVFIDFKEDFDRDWHAALWATMKKYNISTNLIRVIKNLYDKFTSAVLFNSSIGDWRTGKMAETDFKIICGAPTTLAVKGLMMMMMNPL